MITTRAGCGMIVGPWPYRSRRSGNRVFARKWGWGVLAQVLCVVGSSWVGVAAKLGKAHVAFWLAAKLLYYVPLAAVVIHLNRLMPLEGGLYQWAKAGSDTSRDF